MKTLFVFAMIMTACVLSSVAQTNQITVAEADQFAQLVLAGIDREYPNKPSETLGSAADIKSPRAMHPAFFGCFDWHSSVHGHWLLVRLLKLHPEMTNAPTIRARLAEHFTATNLATEAAYFDTKVNASFERMYGWAWTLRLAQELRSWNDPDAQQWAKNFAPLENKMVALIENYLPRLTYPIRTGVHPDTAFALSQILDYARAVGNTKLEQLVVQRAKAYYANDRSYPTIYEPSGEDFFSPGLNVADLMRRVLTPEEFSRWLDAYLPELRAGNLGAWSTPAEVSDLSDARIVHLVGLNLSRAWTMQGVASALPANDPRRAVLEAAMKRHATAGLKYVFSGHYEGEHWLGTFAVYYLSGAGVGPLTY